MSLDNEERESFDLPDEKQDPQKDVDVKLEFKNLEERMLELKGEYREVLVLRYLSELNISEISDILDKRKGNVRVLIYRAIEALKKISQEIDTVFSLGLIARVDENGETKALDCLEELDIPYPHRGKVNVGLGKPLSLK